MRPKLKINNLTNLQDARYSAAVGFDYVSFSLERGSMKKLAPNLIWNIVNWLEGPEIILELNTQSLEELRSVDKTFSYRFITFPIEEWSDLLFQESPHVILRADSRISAEEILEICRDAKGKGFELKVELLLEKISELDFYREVMDYLFVRFNDFFITLELVSNDKYSPYGISFGTEVEDRGLIDYDRIDSFIDFFTEKYGQESV